MAWGRYGMSPQTPKSDFAEAGVPGYSNYVWFGLWAPKGTPQPIIDKLAAAIARIAADPEMKARFAAQGVELRSSTPAELATFLDKEEVRWTTLIKEQGIKAE